MLAGFAVGGAWDKRPPGPELAAALALAAGPDWRCRGASGEQVVGMINRAAAAESWMAALKLALIRAVIRDDDPGFLRGPQRGDLPDAWDPALAREVGLALSASALSADKTMRAAWELGARLPEIGRLLERGVIDAAKARLITEVWAELSDEDAGAAEAMIIPELTAPPGKTYAQVERIATQIALTVDPRSGERRRKAAEERDARVRLYRERAGTAAVEGRDLPADQALAGFAGVNARASQYKASGVFGKAGMDRLRATAFTDLLAGVSAEARIAHGLLTEQQPDQRADQGPDQGAGHPRPDDDRNPDDAAGANTGDGQAGAGPEPGAGPPGRIGGGDCPCQECDGSCLPPDDDDPGDGGPGGGGPGGGGPGDDAPDGDGLDGDGPAEDGPADVDPGEDGPAEDDPSGDGPAEDGPADDDPGGDGPGGRDPGHNPGGPGGTGPDDDGSDGASHAGSNGSRQDPPDQSTDLGGGGPGPVPDQAETPPAGPVGAQPAMQDLVIPLATLTGLAGLADRPGEGHGLGTLDPDLCRALAATATRSPHTTICLTITNARGIAIGHGCATPARPPRGKARERLCPPQPPPLLALPARINLTIPRRELAQLTAPSDSAAQPPTGWTLTPRNAGPPGRRADPGPPGTRTTAPPGTRARSGLPRAHADPDPPRQRKALADPDWCADWTLKLPDGRDFTVRLEPVPTYDCDHRHESHAYQPNDKLRHLIQIRDRTCTFPTCNRHARESDFEHAVPYDQGGRTCACNAGARSRACHRTKQAPGWKVTQPRPGWHQWQTPRGRTYTQGPNRYPV